MTSTKLKAARSLKGAVVVILDGADRVLLGKRPTDIPCWAPGKWAFPGGKIERDESPHDAAVRETKEEMNLEIKNLKEHAPGRASVALYYTRDYEGDIQIDHEHTDWAWVGGDEIENYDLAPDVLAMYRWVLENE